MISKLKEYYDIQIDFYKKYNDGIIFFVNGDYFYFFNSYVTEDELNKIIELSFLVKSKGVILHDFVFNKYGKVLSESNILIKLNHLVDDVTIDDLNKFNIYIGNSESEKFHEMWRDKIDYLEHQLIELSGNKVINNSFDYYVGVAEQVLILLEEKHNYSDDLYLVHRSFRTLSSVEFYNPVNIEVGNRFKDISSYILLNNDWSLLNELLDYINDNDKVYLFVRLSFPFRYFNSINSFVIGENEDENIILSYVQDIDKYERYLLKLESLFNLNLFYWIKKDN